MITLVKRLYKGGILGLCLIFTQLAQAVEVSYTVAMTAPTTGLIDITMEIRDANSGNVEVAIPGWSPGFYRMRGWAKNIQQLYAEDGTGNKLNSQQIDTSQWRISPAPSMIKLHYKVYVGNRRMDDTHLSLMGPSTLMYLLDGNSPYPAKGTLKLTVEAPANWKIATGLERVSEGVFTAPDYDTLIDAPLEIAADLDQFSFEDHGATYEIVIRNPHNYDRDNFAKEIKHIVSELAEMMGGVPYDRYVFLFTGQNTRGGGLEHLNSTTISFKRYDDTSSKDYRRLRFLIAHEFFHLWNIKRIRPEIYGPFDYSKPQHSRNLYVSEGMTDYFAYLAVGRQGLWTKDIFYEELAEVINKHQSAPGHLITTVEDTSWNNWSPSDNRDHTQISYYTKGSLIGLLLDMEIRERTRNRRSLDDVFRQLMKEGGLPKPGFKEEDGFIKTVQAITAEGKGDTDYEQFFADYVSGLKELDYDKALAQVGLKLEISKDDPEPSLGLETKEEGKQLIVNKIDFDGAAYNAGIMKQDVLLAIDGERVIPKLLKSRLNSKKIGAKVDVLVMRGDRVITVPLVLADHNKSKYKIVEDKKASRSAVRVRNSWFKPYTTPIKLNPEKKKDKKETS